MYRDRRLLPLFAAGAGSLLLVAQSPAQFALPSPDAEVCKLLPTPELEAALGSAVARKVGTDSATLSSCTVTAGAATAKLEIQPPGQLGLPTNVAAGLAGVQATVGSTMQRFETEDAGNVGCYRGTLTVQGFGSTNTTSCFMPSGYIVLTLARGDNLVPFAPVKELLQSVAANAPKAR
jgi:hypothetical protein